MTLFLLKIGLVLTPFYELVLKLFPYCAPVAPDTRVAKLFLGTWLALAIGVSALFKGEIRECRNKWILLLIAYIPLNIHLSPKYAIDLNGIDSTNYWVWKPFVFCLCYFLMFLCVQSMNINKKSLEKIFRVMVWCGAIMAGYVLLQNAGWDQFFNVRTGGQFDFVTKPTAVGSLGNSTIVSPYIALIIPFALYLRKYAIAGLMISAVIATQSGVAIGAMGVSLLVYSCLRWKSRGVLAVVLAVSLGIAGLIGYQTVKQERFTKITESILNTNGRMNVWKKSIKTIKEHKFGGSPMSKFRNPYTGIGLGSYSVLMKPILKTPFDKAHNEYLEVFCTLGIAGLFLFLAAIGFILKSVFFAYIDNFSVPEITALFSSFFCMLLIAFGTFIFQLSPHNYYAVLVVGLLHNRRILKGELE